MKQWKAAAGLAGLASLVLVASLGWGSGSTDPSRSDQQAATTASAQAGAAGPGDSPYRRSEEHTSELQSLMRISYAVFCLKKKKTLMNTTHDDYSLIKEK